MTANNFELLFSTSYGNLLTIKIILVIALIITYIIHVRIIRKDVEEQIMSKKMSEQQIKKLRSKIIILGEIIVIISVAILFMAALLNSSI
jgi:putative copper resistance protein D